MTTPVRIPSGQTWDLWMTRLVALFFAAMGLFLLIGIQPVLANAHWAAWLYGPLFALAVLMWLFGERSTIRAVVLSDSGVTYEYWRKSVHVGWPDVRPPQGPVRPDWTRSSGLFFTDHHPSDLLAVKYRRVTLAQAKEIMDYPVVRTWDIGNNWKKAFLLPSRSLRERWNYSPRLLKIGLVSLAIALALGAIGVISLALGIIPSCAYSSYSCPTPDWFNDSFYPFAVLLFIGAFASLEAIRRRGNLFENQPSLP
jgi:hypothetical protein